MSSGSAPACNDFGAFVISLDFELAWGLRHHGTSDDSVRRRILRARRIVSQLLRLFGERDIAATWATVGFLFAGSHRELNEFSPRRRPRYADRSVDPYLEAVGAGEQDDPLHFGRSLIAEISRHPRQEVASHTFSHFLCLEEGQDEVDFRADLDAARRIAQSQGLSLRSLVFPSNQLNPSYLAAVRDAGFIAYRGNQPGALHRPAPRGAHGLGRRAARAADCYVPLEHSHLSGWSELVDSHGLCNVTASRFLRPYVSSAPFLEPLRLRRIVQSLTEAATSQRIFHLWWHPHNFGVNSNENLAFLTRLLDEFAILRERHGMRSMGMAEVAECALDTEGGR